MMTETPYTQISSNCAEELFRKLLIFLNGLTKTLSVITVIQNKLDEIETNVAMSHESKIIIAIIIIIEL